MSLYLLKRAQNWHNIHSKYQKCNDIHSVIFDLFIKYFEKCWEQVTNIHVILLDTY